LLVSPQTPSEKDKLMSKYKLYIIEYYENPHDDKLEFEWFWATSEKDSERQFIEWCEDWEIVDTAEINNNYDITVPARVIESYIE
jgi:hypothetical protein